MSTPTRQELIERATQAQQDYDDACDRANASPADDSLTADCDAALADLEDAQRAIVAADADVTVEA